MKRKPRAVITVVRKDLEEIADKLQSLISVMDFFARVDTTSDKSFEKDTRESRDNAVKKLDKYTAVNIDNMEELVKFIDTGENLKMLKEDLELYDSILTQLDTAFKEFYNDSLVTYFYLNNLIYKYKELLPEDSKDKDRFDNAVTLRSQCDIIQKYIDELKGEENNGSRNKQKKCATIK